MRRLTFLLILFLAPFAEAQGPASIVDTKKAGAATYAVLGQDTLISDVILSKIGNQEIFLEEGIYIFRLVLFIRNTMACDGAKFDFAGGTLRAQAFQAQGEFWSENSLIRGTRAQALSRLHQLPEVSGNATFKVTGTIIISESGSFAARFAKNTKGAGNLVVLKGSYLAIEDALRR